MMSLCDAGDMNLYRDDLAINKSEWATAAVASVRRSPRRVRLLFRAGP